MIVIILPTKKIEISFCFNDINFNICLGNFEVGKNCFNFTMALSIFAVEAIGFLLKIISVQLYRYLKICPNR